MLDGWSGSRRSSSGQASAARSTPWRRPGDVVATPRVPVRRRRRRAVRAGLERTAPRRAAPPRVADGAHPARRRVQAAHRQAARRRPARGGSPAGRRHRRRRAAEGPGHRRRRTRTATGCVVATGDAASGDRRTGDVLAGIVGALLAARRCDAVDARPPPGVAARPRRRASARRAASSPATASTLCPVVLASAGDCRRDAIAARPLGVGRDRPRRDRRTTSSVLRTVVAPAARVGGGQGRRLRPRRGRRRPGPPLDAGRRRAVRRARRGGRRAARGGIDGADPLLSEQPPDDAPTVVAHG